MTDQALAQAFQQAQQWEKALRDYVKTEDQAERDSAVNVMRLVIAQRRSIETWIAVRALRKQLQPVAKSVG